MPAVRRKLTISTFSSLSARWLMPRVQAFSALFPDTDLQVITSTRLVDFAREDVDIAHALRRRQYPGLHVRPMFKPKEIVVASPALLKRGPPLKTFADLQATTRCCTTTRIAPGSAGSTPSAPRASIPAAASSAAIATRCCRRRSKVRASASLRRCSRRASWQPGGWCKVFDAEVSAEFAIYAVCLPRRLNDPLIVRHAWSGWCARRSPHPTRTRRRPERSPGGAAISSNSLSSSARARSAADGSRGAPSCRRTSASRSVRALLDAADVRAARTRRAAA